MLICYRYSDRQNQTICGPSPTGEPARELPRLRIMRQRPHIMS